MANMLLEGVWKRHQILSLGEPGWGLPRGCFLMGSLSPFETGVHSPPLDLRSMAGLTRDSMLFSREEGMPGAAAARPAERRFSSFTSLKSKKLKWEGR